MTLRERLDAKGIRPVVIERTQPQPGHIVLRSWALPVTRVTADADLPSRVMPREAGR